MATKDPAPVVVIGAGISGLSTALSLSRLGHNVRILEARDRLGGRIDTLTDPGLPCPIDAGASFVHGVDGNPLVELARQHGITLTFPDRQSGGIAYSPEGPPIPDDVAAKLTIRLFSNLFLRSRLAAQTELDPSPHDSLASWLYSPDSPLFDGLEPEWRDTLKKMVGMFDGWTGAALEDVSLRWWGFEQEFEGADAVVRDGYHRFIDAIARELDRNGVKISLGREVVGVRLEEEDEQVTVAHRAVGSSDGDDDSTTASHVVCTLPLGVLRSVPSDFFSPPLPPRRRSSLDKLGFGLLNKVILSYDRPFWPTEPTWLQFLPREEDCDDPVLGRTMGAQNQVAISGNPVLVFFGGAGLGEVLEKEDPVALEKKLRGKLAFHLGTDVPEAKRCIVTKWRSDRWAKGSYAFIPVGKEGDSSASPLDLLELSKPLWEGRLGFAGEATSVDHFATVHGPFLTGMREASRIHTLLASSSQDP